MALLIILTVGLALIGAIVAWTALGATENRVSSYLVLAATGVVVVLLGTLVLLW